MRFKRLVLSLMAVSAVAFAIVPGAVSAHQRHQRTGPHQGSGTPGTWPASVPRYRHIVEIMMENTSYGTIIGNSLAPNINALANQYGLATNYFGVTHPSEPNYVANLGGDVLRHPGRQPVLLHAGAGLQRSQLRRHHGQPHRQRPVAGRPADRQRAELEGLLPEPAPRARTPVWSRRAPTPTAPTRTSGRAAPTRCTPPSTTRSSTSRAPRTRCRRWSPTTSWAATCSPTTWPTTAWSSPTSATTCTAPAAARTPTA